MSKWCKCFDFSVYIYRDVWVGEWFFCYICLYIFGNYVYTMKMDEHRGKYIYSTIVHNKVIIKDIQICALLVEYGL